MNKTKLKNERGASFLSYSLLAGILALVCIPGAHMVRAKVQGTACVAGGHIGAATVDTEEQLDSIDFDESTQTCFALKRLEGGEGEDWGTDIVFRETIFNNAFF